MFCSTVACHLPITSTWHVARAVSVPFVSVRTYIPEWSLTAFSLYMEIVNFFGPGRVTDMMNCSPLSMAIPLKVTDHCKKYIYCTNLAMSFCSVFVNYCITVIMRSQTQVQYRFITSLYILKVYCHQYSVLAVYSTYDLDLLP